MKFPYSISIAPSVESGDAIVMLRPEVLLRLHGPRGHFDIMALVDTGADNSIFPLSVAHHLGITPMVGRGPGPVAFGGQQISLSFANVQLELVHDEGALSWVSRLYFADIAGETTATALIGHEGFLDISPRCSMGRIAPWS